MSGASPVSLERKGDIGVIIVNNPPVNALVPASPRASSRMLERGNADPAIKAMVLIGAGRSFIAGADIRRFGTSRARRRSGSARYDVLDDSRQAGGRGDPRLCARRRAGESRWPAITASPCRAPRSACPKC